MKKVLMLLPLLVVLSCTGTKETFDTLRKIPKQNYTPPGTVWLRDNLFIDETEVSNFSYLEFLYWLKRNKYSAYNLMLPDTLCWDRADIGNADKLITNYSDHPTYRYYPVIGISYNQAVYFCEWRSYMVNELLYIRANKLKHHPDSEKVYMARAPKKVKYRLPTKEEWEYAAAAGLDYCNFPMGYESLTTYNVPVNNTLEYYNYYTKDFRAIDKKCEKAIEVGCPTTGIYSGKANRYGLYQMLGNVSELTADTLVKGFNYSLPLYNIERSESERGSYTMNSLTYNYTISKKYKRPEPWIGFRCVAEILEK